MIENLPDLPESKEGVDEWKHWVEDCAHTGRWDVLRDAESEDDARVMVALRAIIAHWAGESVALEDASKAACHLLKKAHEAPPEVFRAVELFADRCMRDGVTAADVLYLCAALAWPLQDVSATSSRAWNYLVHAPWQADADQIQLLCELVDPIAARRGGRGLLDLAEARLDAGQIKSAQALLEAMVALQAGVKSIEHLTSASQLKAKPQVQDAERALCLLAIHYRDSGATAPHAREILRWAVESTAERDGLTLAQTLEERVWDRSFAECYEWADDSTLEWARVDAEIKRALDANQPWHARRLGEAVLVKQWDPKWVGNAETHFPKAVHRFCEEKCDRIVGNHLGRTAVNHLAQLYMRTHHTTVHTQKLVERLVGDAQLSVHFVGQGAPLHPARADLEQFVNSCDPYILLQEQDSRLYADTNLTDQEKRARDEVQRWFADRAAPSDRGVIDRAISVVTAPIVDLSRALAGTPVERVCVTAFGIAVRSAAAVAGDIGPLREEGEQIRAEAGFGLPLITRARELALSNEFIATTTAGVISFGRSFLPPGVGLMAGAADLGSTLLCAFRAVSQVQALYGLEPGTPAAWRLAADAFALGCSSNNADGLLAYLSRGRKETFESVLVGSVAYGGAALATHLWTRPQLDAGMLLEEAIHNLSRLCGISLSERELVSVVPLVGVVFSGVTAFTFVRSITEAAIHLAARDALLERVQR